MKWHSQFRALSRGSSPTTPFSQTSAVFGGVGVDGASTAAPTQPSAQPSSFFLQVIGAVAGLIAVWTSGYAMGRQSRRR